MTQNESFDRHLQIKKIKREGKIDCLVCPMNGCFLKKFRNLLHKVYTPIPVFPYFAEVFSSPVLTLEEHNTTVLSEYHPTL